MRDFKKMTVQNLRELARKLIGPGHSRLKTKQELVSALEDAGTPPAAGKASKAPKAAKASKPARATSRAADAAGKVARAAKAVAERATSKATQGAAQAKRATRAAAAGAAAGARAAGKPARGRGKVASAAAAVAGAAVGAAMGAAATIRGARKPTRAAEEESAAVAPVAAKGAREPHGPDPEGYFVARVRGEKALREAPHPLGEADSDEAGEYLEGTPADASIYDEQLGELPWGYGDDAFVALPRDPRTLFLYWDHARETLEAGFGGLDHPRAQLWLFARAGEGWERIRVLEFALESRGYYLHDLDPGRVYRAEIHVVDRQGNARQVSRGSNAVALPPVGPSPIVDDRFIRIPWEVPLGRLLGRGHEGGPFSEEARALLARLSDWSRFAGRAVWGGSAGGMGGRPSSPTSSPSGPPSSPSGPFGMGDA